jgi:hypothetical protein
MNIQDAAAVIDELLGKFDFEKVRAVMVLTDWKWYDKHVPTVDELRECARVRLWTVCRADTDTSSALGGLTAYRDGGEVGLAFELEGHAVTLETA